MAGFLPISETALLRMAPPYQTTGIIPRGELLGNERVIWEGRPTLAAWQWVALVWGIFWLLGFIAVGAADTAAGAGIGQFVSATFVGLFFAIPLFFALWYWRNASYGMTNQRVLSRQGSQLASLSWTMVGRVRFNPSGSIITFDAISPPGVPPFAPETLRRATVAWPRVPSGPTIVAFASSALYFYGIRNRQIQLRQEMVMGATADRIICAYCKNPMRIEDLDPANPVCPRCGAAIEVAPGPY